MIRSTRPPHVFEYAPLVHGGGYAGEPDRDLIVATVEDVDPARIVELAGRSAPNLSVTSVFSSHPVFWTRIESTQPIDVPGLLAALGSGGVGVRFVTSARRGQQGLPPPLDFRYARPRCARAWAARSSTTAAEPDTPWRWFLRPEGAAVDRAFCGTGAGTRLALIDDDGRDLERVPLDAEVPVGVPTIPRAQSHGALLLAWGVGAKRQDGGDFRGVAPDASPRLYCIPKPGEDVLSLPLAILRAVEDGADVVVCATYVDGLMSPLLDDALEVAVRLGRGGLGTAVVMPTSREMSSPEGSTHSSLSLGLGEPASDPRVFCVGPSARDGGWFLWRDRRGRFRPFANRGPAVRWLAPGDDMAMPFANDDRPAHAESSGASGIAAGVVLLLMGLQPSLPLGEVAAVLDATLSPVDPLRHADDPTLADRRDLEPYGLDRDGHNAKHGYGRLNATAACLAVLDPVAQVLVRMGEQPAAESYARARREELAGLYSPGLARWAAHVALADANLYHALAAVARALRLHASAREAPEEPAGYWLRQLGVVLRLFAARAEGTPHERELRELEARLRLLRVEESRNLEATLKARGCLVWAVETNTPSRVVELRGPEPRSSASR